MTNLAPMIRLDIANLTSFRRAVIPMLIALGIMAWTNGILLASTMLYLCGFLVTINSFSMDERYRLHFLYAGLPVSRRTVITSHYLVGAGMLLIVEALVLPSAVLSALAGNGEFVTQARTGAAIIMFTSVAFAVLAPLVVTFGTRVLAYISIGFLVVFAGGSYLISRLNITPDLSPITRLFTNHTVLGVSVVIALVVLSWITSWSIAARFFDAKDF